MRFLKKHKMKIIIVAIVLVVVVGFVIPSLTSKVEALASPIDYITLEKGELISSVNVKGTVKSEESHVVYASNGYEILNVNVEVGDKVTEGQQLMMVDTRELESSINERKALLSKQSQANLVQLENAQRQYGEARQNFSSGQDSNLVSANSRVETSKNALDNAQKNYDDRIKEHDNKDNAQLINSEAAVRNAEIDLEKKQETFDKNKILFDSGAISQNEYDLSEQALTASKNGLEDAKKSLANIATNMDSEVRALKQALDTAQITYDEAKESLKSTEIALSQGVDKYQDGVKSAEVSINNDSDLIAIKNMEDKLNKANIKSPINGTVTAVYAKDGASASGLMFVIEDTDSLKIDTKIKEFDSNRIKEGMEVVIKSEATGEEEYEGKISKIAPTSVKDNLGQTAQTSDTEFETEIKVITDKTDLKIGMKTKLTIIMDKRADVLYVPFDALAQDEDGSDIVYVIEESNDVATAKKVPVQISLETDFYAQIEGNGITAGTRIINNPANITDGMTLKMPTENEVEGSN